MIVAAEGERERDAAVIVTPVGHGAYGTRDGEQPARWVERDRELAVLGDLARRTAAGHPGLVVVQGPDGFGRTSLLHTLAVHARRLGLRVLHTRADPNRRTLPLGTVRTLWRAMTADPLPDLAAPPRRPVPGEADRARAGVSHEALTEWHEAVRTTAVRGPLLIAIDDVHEADPVSLRCLAYTARRLAGLPVLLALGRRDGDAWTPLDEAAMTQPLCRVVRPRPLTAPGVGRVARRLTGADPETRFQTDCLAATGGNPLLVTGLVTALRERGLPLTGAGLDAAGDHDLPAFRECVIRLLRRQPPPTVRAAQAVAVLGDAADRETCAQLARADATTFARALSALDSLGLAHASSRTDGWSLTHPAVRNAVLADTPAGQRAALHGRAARLLHDGGAPASDIAEHLLRSRVTADQPWARAVLREAARKAMLDGAAARAVELLRRCVPDGAADARDPDLVAELGIAESRVDTAAGIRHLTAVLDRVSRPGLRFASLSALVGGLARTGQVDRAVTLLARHRSAMAGTAAGAASARLLEADMLMAATDNLDAYTELLNTESFHMDLPGDTPEARALLAWRAVISVCRMDHVPQALTAADTVIRMGGPTTDSTVTLAAAASVLLYGDRPHEADRAYRQLMDGTDAVRSQAYPTLLALGAAAGERLGALDEALRTTAKALRKTRIARATRYEALPLAVRLHTFLDQGDLTAATGLAAEMPDPRADDDWQWNELLCARGRLHLAQGEPRAALRDLTECGHRQRAWHRTNPAVSFWWYWAGRAHLAVGDRTAAVELGEWAVGLARPAGLPCALGTGLELLAEAADERDRLALLDEAESVLAPTRAALLLAGVRVLRGRALQRAGHIQAARTVLRKSWREAHSLGARALHAAAHQALLATGARPRRAVSGGSGALTRSEAQVARLAADGWSNTRIADALFVTRRTVEAHLTSVYRKLGLSSGRRELRRGLEPDTDAGSAEPPHPR
ncbi:ATP-binding protein [Streptomyces malaysiensis]|uniref:ATP-binding protein n=1 Tax=Streptomyces malaysiensis TaxID=92644 RepID=UPI00085332B4|nr:LuxR family transcriptional regulator [Streptomyces sp. SPMA113]